MAEQQMNDLVGPLYDMFVKRVKQKREEQLSVITAAKEKIRQRTDALESAFAPFEAVLARVGHLRLKGGLVVGNVVHVDRDEPEGQYRVVCKYSGGRHTWAAVISPDDLSVCYCSDHRLSKDITPILEDLYGHLASIVDPAVFDDLEVKSDAATPSTSP